ncbi:MAG: rRNA maturation RNase YbeY [Clostridiales bacterium]|nr:rRNA maturation RNase YbeY [Clostridiales bacterium]
MTLYLSWQGGAAPLSQVIRRRLRQAVKLCLLRMKADPKWEVSLLLTNNLSIQRINRKYRGMNQPTDVLSFAFRDPDLFRDTGAGMAAEPPLAADVFHEADSPGLLGEIVISVERAAEQALAYGHSLERELVFLTVHGMLHLLGMDHKARRERVRMEKLQRQILRLMDLPR